jgi:hypothetical protein
MRRCCRGNANDQASGRDDAIVGPEHGCPQPPDALDKMVLGVQTKTTHGYLLITLVLLFRK